MDKKILIYSVNKVLNSMWTTEHHTTLSKPFLLILIKGLNPGENILFTI